MRSIQEQLSLDGYINIPFSPVGSDSEPAAGLDERFCEVMDAAPIMIWVSGRDKGCLWFNRPWLAFTGRNMAQEVGRGWADGVHEDDFERCMNVYSSHFDARSEFRMHYRLRRHDGEYRWIDDAGVHDTPKVVLFSAISVPVSTSTSIERRKLNCAAVCRRFPS
jgi:PAS domain S-box-containing protein